MTDLWKIDINIIRLDKMGHEGCVEAEGVGSGVCVEVMKVAKLEVRVKSQAVWIPWVTWDSLTYGYVLGQPLNYLLKA